MLKPIWEVERSCEEKLLLIATSESKKIQTSFCDGDAGVDRQLSYIVATRSNGCTQMSLNGLRWFTVIHPI
jgi:hypothetical protein